MPYSLLISLTDLPRSLSSNIYRLNSFVYRFCFKTIFPVLLYNLLYFYPYSLSHILYQIQGFEKIDVASDVNTIKIALKSGILNCAIPLVSSFIDIFSYQYGLIDTMSAKAWRRVWEIWSKKYPDEHIDSPCLIISYTTFWADSFVRKSFVILCVKMDINLLIMEPAINTVQFACEKKE